MGIRNLHQIKRSQGQVKVGGNRVVGEALTVSAMPGFIITAVQWMRDGVAIAGATSESYTLVSADLGKTVYPMVSGYSPVCTPIKGGNVVESVMRIVASAAYLPGARINMTTTSSFQRIPLKVVGGAVSVLQFGFASWYPSSNQDKTPTPIGNTLSLNKVGLELADGSLTVPVNFGGMASRVLANPEYQALSDEIPASAFGLDHFADGQKLWLRVEASTPVSGNYWPYQSWASNSVPGFHAGFFDATATTLTNGAYSTGTPVYTGTAPSTLNFALPAVMLGKYVDSADDKTLVVVGDSIDYGRSDSDQYNWTSEAGQGSTARVCYRENIPMLNLAIFGSTSVAYANKPEAFVPWFKYARFATEGHGGNDLANGYTAAAIQSRLQAKAAAMRAEGIEKIARFTLPPRTTSTDSWATVANQANRPYFGPGTDAEVLYNWFVNDSVGAGVYDQVIDITATDAVENRWYWAANGTANWATNDGLHPTPARSILIADEVQPQIRALVS